MRFSQCIALLAFVQKQLFTRALSSLKETSVRSLDRTDNQRRMELVLALSAECKSKGEIVLLIRSISGLLGMTRFIVRLLSFFFFFFFFFNFLFFFFFFFFFFKFALCGLCVCSCFWFLYLFLSSTCQTAFWIPPQVAEHLCHLFAENRSRIKLLSRRFEVILHLRQSRGSYCRLRFVRNSVFEGKQHVRRRIRCAGNRFMASRPGDFVVTVIFISLAHV
jgi:hypothetical protein